MSDTKNKKPLTEAQKYDEETGNLILKTVRDLLGRLDTDLAENLVFSAIKLNNVHFADIIDTVNEAQKRRNLITLMYTTKEDEIVQAAKEDLLFYGYLF